MTRIVAIVQARMGSSRLPGKVLRPLVGKPVLWHVLHRLGKCKRVDAIVVATTEQAADDSLTDYARAQGVAVVRGPEEDVLGRYMMAAEQSHADVVVRVTGDAPLVDPAIIDLLIDTLLGEGAEFCTGKPDVPTLHEGFSPLTTSLLRRLQDEVGDDPAAREHVTGYLSLHPEFARTAYAEIPSAHHFTGARVSVDTPQDVQFLEALYARIGALPGDLDVADVVGLLHEHPQLLRINAGVRQKAADERSLRVLIRCDGDHELGLGHVSRCTAIAEALRTRHGCGVLFAVQKGPEGAALLKQAAFPVTLASDGSEHRWLDELTARWHPDAMLLDVRTDLPAEPLHRWREQGIVVAVLDDASERRLAADLAFYPPVPQVASLEWPGFSGQLLVGWEWIPLRQGFQCIGTRTEAEPLRVLVTMGGSDPANLSLLAAKALGAVRQEFRATFVLGSGYRRESELQRALARVRYPYRILRRVDDMPQLMSQSDLAVASFGVTAYELAAMGVPAIYLCLSRDHAAAADALVKAWVGVSLGVYTEVTEQALASAIASALSDPQARARWSRAGTVLVDGGGAFRIADTLMSATRSRRPPSRTDSLVGGVDDTGGPGTHVTQYVLKSRRRTNWSAMSTSARKRGQYMHRCTKQAAQRRHRMLDRPIVEWNAHRGPGLDIAGSHQVIECETCGFKHIVPIPSRGELEQVYREQYYSTEKPLYLLRHEEDLEWWNLVYSERYDSFEAHLPASRRRLLDVGSGTGHFLLSGANRGWDVLGVEPSRQAVAYGRSLGVEVLEHFLEPDLVPRLGRFDVVHMNSVLEHIPDPATLIAMARDLLDPGGLLCVTVPNDYNPFQLALRECCAFQPWWVTPPHHINYFNFDSLGALLERQDFDLVLREASFPIDMFLLMGDNYVGNSELGRICHTKRKQFDLNLASSGFGGVKRSLYRALAQEGLGREVIMIGRKP